MERQLRTSRTSEPQLDSPDQPAGDGDPSELLQQARGWAAVAQQAHQRCQSGADAEQEVHRRRNQPGQ